MATQTFQTNTSTPHQVGAIFKLTIREARRRSLLWIGLGLGLVFVALFGVGFYFGHRDFIRSVEEFGIVGADGFTLEFFATTFATAGLYVINFLIVMVAVLTTVAAISGEIQTNTVHAIAVKPLRRWEIIVGKWLGHAVMLATLTVLLVLGIVLPVWVISGVMVSNLLVVTAILVLEALTVMSVTLLGSVLLPTLANGVLIFMLYGVAFVGGWVEQIGSLLDSRTAVDLGIASSLLMPSEGLWRYAAAQMQTASGALDFAGPFQVLSQPSDAFVIYGIVYVVGTVALAAWAFSQRDF